MPVQRLVISSLKLSCLVSLVVSFFCLSQPYHWPRDGACRNEPRLGRRLTLGAVIELPLRYLAADTSALSTALCRALTLTVTKSQSKKSEDSAAAAELAAAEIVVAQCRHTYVPPAVALAAGPVLEAYDALLAHNNSNATDAVPSAAEVDACPRVSLIAYTAHAEPFCGLTHRLDVIADVLQHARVMFNPALATALTPVGSGASANTSTNTESKSTSDAATAGGLTSERVATLRFTPGTAPRASSAPVHFQVFAGDLNTLAHSLARYSATYARDAQRWRSLGWAEAEWLAAHVWAQYDYDDARAAREARRVRGLGEELLAGDAEARRRKRQYNAALKVAAMNNSNDDGDKRDSNDADDDADADAASNEEFISNLVEERLRDPLLVVPLNTNNGKGNDALPDTGVLTVAQWDAAASKGGDGKSKGGELLGPAPRYLSTPRNAGYGHGRTVTVCTGFPLTLSNSSSSGASKTDARVYTVPEPEAVAALPLTLSVSTPVAAAVPEDSDTAPVRLSLPWAALTNPGFEEVFPPETETFTNYRGWFHGKLDHLLARGLAAVAARTGNDDYAASDHKSLTVDAFLVPARLWPLRRNAAGVDASAEDEAEEDAAVAAAAAAAGPRDYFESAPEKKQRLPPVLDPGLMLRLPNTNSSNTTSSASAESLDDVWVPTLPCYLKRAYAENHGAVGYVNRNCTPFVTQLSAGIVALVFVAQFFWFA